MKRVLLTSALAVLCAAGVVLAQAPQSEAEKQLAAIVAKLDTVIQNQAKLDTILQNQDKIIQKLIIIRQH